MLTELMDKTDLVYAHINNLLWKWPAERRTITQITAVVKELLIRYKVVPRGKPERGMHFYMLRKAPLQIELSYDNTRVKRIKIPGHGRLVDEVNVALSSYNSENAMKNGAVLLPELEYFTTGL